MENTVLKTKLRKRKRSLTSSQLKDYFKAQREDNRSSLVQLGFILVPWVCVTTGRIYKNGQRTLWIVTQEPFSTTEASGVANRKRENSPVKTLTNLRLHWSWNVIGSHDDQRVTKLISFV